MLAFKFVCFLVISKYKTKLKQTEKIANIIAIAHQ